MMIRSITNGGMVLALLLAPMLAGCQGTKSQSATVAAMNTHHPVALEAYDVARAMREAGFSNEQILDIGTDVRNAIARSGGAQVRLGESTEALLAAEERHLHVTSRGGATQSYPLPAPITDHASATGTRPTHAGSRSAAPSADDSESR